MKEYYGLIISVENYHDSTNLKKVGYANNDSTGIYNAFIELGCNPDNFELLQDNLATKTAIESKVSQLASYANHGEVLVFYFAGHGILTNGINYLTSVDSVKSDIASTSIPIEFILSEFEKSEAERVMIFLDCCHSGISFDKEVRRQESNFSTDELKYKYSNSEHLIVFASCKDNEVSISDSSLNHGVWSYYLLQALTGNTPSLYQSNLLFSSELQAYLNRETFAKVRLLTPNKKNQTPIKYGKETTDKFIIADLTEILKKRLDKFKNQNIKFERATIISHDSAPIRKLPGFKRTHSVPKVKDNYHENWIQKIAEELIKSNIEEIAENCKSHLKLKRSEFLNTKIENGYAQLSTIHFDYTVKIEQSSEEPSNYIIVQSIENFRDPEIFGKKEFNNVFGYIFNQIKFTATTEIDVDSIIDKIEALDSQDITVKYPTDGTPLCKIELVEFDGHIIVTNNSISFETYSSKRPVDLSKYCDRGYAMLTQNIEKKLLE